MAYDLLVSLKNGLVVGVYNINSPRGYKERLPWNCFLRLPDTFPAPRGRVYIDLARLPLQVRKNLINHDVAEVDSVVTFLEPFPVVDWSKSNKSRIFELREILSSKMKERAYLQHLVDAPIAEAISGTRQQRRDAQRNSKKIQKKQTVKTSLLDLQIKEYENELRTEELRSNASR